MKKFNFIGAAIGGILGLLFGFCAHGMLLSITGGLWSVEEGAPWVAIYAVFIAPAICGFVYGLTKGIGYGFLAGIISPFVIALIDYFACLVIGLFLSGSALTLVLGIVIFMGLFAGPGRVLIIFIGE